MYRGLSLGCCVLFFDLLGTRHSRHWTTQDSRKCAWPPTFKAKYLKWRPRWAADAERAPGCVCNCHGMPPLLGRNAEQLVQGLISSDPYAGHIR